jgi:hypothetical protein
MPSAVHALVRSRLALKVSRRWVLPSAFMTKISERPFRSLANAIFVPSGDQRGDRSSPGLAVS